jgi:hypothetical protein
MRVPTKDTLVVGASGFSYYNDGWAAATASGFDGNSDYNAVLIPTTSLVMNDRLEAYGVYTITYTAFDFSSPTPESGSCFFTITVEDLEFPIFPVGSASAIVTFIRQCDCSCDDIFRVSSFLCECTFYVFFSSLHYMRANLTINMQLHTRQDCGAPPTFASSYVDLDGVTVYRVSPATEDDLYYTLGYVPSRWRSSMLLSNHHLHVISSFLTYDM